MNHYTQNDQNFWDWAKEQCKKIPLNLKEQLEFEAELALLEEMAAFELNFPQHD